MTDLETQELLEKIAQAVQEAGGDEKKEAQLIDALVDPQDALNCDSCQ